MLRGARDRTKRGAWSCFRFSLVYWRVGMTNLGERSTGESHVAGVTPTPTPADDGHGLSRPQAVTPMDAVVDVAKVDDIDEATSASRPAVRRMLGKRVRYSDPAGWIGSDGLCIGCATRPLSRQ